MKKPLFKWSARVFLATRGYPCVVGKGGLESLNLTSNILDTSINTFIGSSQVYQIVSGSTGSAVAGGGFVANSGSYGLLFPQLGTILLNPLALKDVLASGGIGLATSQSSNSDGLNNQRLFNAISGAASFALNSQEKTQKAINENKFKNELIKLKIDTDNKNFLFEKDEHPRSNLNLEDLKKLKTVFKENGTVTAGNSSGINDGAAAIVLMPREEAELRAIEPLAKVVSWATCGVEPSLMGLGPIQAVNIALEKAEWTREDVDLFEINEAFAAQSIAVIRDLKIPKEIVNVNGGAIALGHPIGASGTRILVTLIHELIRQNKRKGCATLCIGGGMGIAMCIERN